MWRDMDPIWDIETNFPQATNILDLEFVGFDDLEYLTHKDSHNIFQEYKDQADLVPKWADNNRWILYLQY